MGPTSPDFRLAEDIDLVFRELCKAYGVDGSLLSWQYEKHAILHGETPFKMSTSDFTKQVELKNGVEKVVFEVEFAEVNPNVIKFIKFNESPTKRFYIVTQTSMLHANEDNTCPLWLELPLGARKEDIGAVQNLLKVNICCKEWADFLPAAPETALERARLVVAEDDVQWIKKQLLHKDSLTSRLTNTLACKNLETVALKKEVEKLKVQLDEKLAPTKEFEEKEIIMKEEIEDLKTKLAQQVELMEALELDSPTPAPKMPTLKKRKFASPKPRTAAASTPKTAPYTRSIFDPMVTPTRSARTSRTPLPDHRPHGNTAPR